MQCIVGRWCWGASPNTELSFGLADLLGSCKRIRELPVPHEPATKTTRLLMLCFGGAYSRIFPDRSAMQRHIGPGGVWGSWAFGEHPYFIIAVRWTDKHCLIPPLVELQEIPKWIQFNDGTLIKTRSYWWMETLQAVSSLYLNDCHPDREKDSMTWIDRVWLIHVLNHAQADLFSNKHDIFRIHNVLIFSQCLSRRLRSVSQSALSVSHMQWPWWYIIACYVSQVPLKAAE